MSAVDLDESLYRRTIEIAQSRGQLVDEFVSETLRQAVGAAHTSPAAYQRATKNGIDDLIVNGATPSLDDREARRMIEEQGF